MAVRAEEDVAHFLSLEALEEYHYRIFQPGAQLHYIGELGFDSRLCNARHYFLTLLAERPLVSYNSGMATATLRVREIGNPNYEEHLRDAFVALFEL